MRLVLESDGTLTGTVLSLQMTADEIPALVAKHRRYKARKLKRMMPPNAVAVARQPKLTLVS